MKILILSASLYLTDNKPAGEGLIAFELLKRISKKCDLTVIAPKIDIKQKVQFKYIELGKYIFFPTPDEFRYKLNWWKYIIKSYFVIKKLEKNFSFDIFHFMMPVNIGQTFSLFYNKPFIIGPVFYPWLDIDNEYGENFNIKLDLFYKIKYRIIRYNNVLTQKLFLKFLNFADKIILTLKKVEEVLPKNIRDKFVYIPVGVDTKYFIPPRLRGKKDILTILFSSYLVKRKGLHYLIEAFKVVLKNCSQKIRLQIVGDGPDKNFFLKKIKEEEVEESVDFVGFVEHNKTLEYFQQADIYCHPALGEPFGLSIVEAMSCELPVVAFNLGGAGEVLTDANREFLVKPRDTKELAEKLLLLSENAVLRLNVGKKNREIAERLYDWDIIAEKYYEIYNSVKF